MPKPATLAGKKLGIMLAADPGLKNFQHAIGIAQAASRQGVEVFIYFIDDAVKGLNQPQIKDLATAGVRIFGCAFSLQRRRLPMEQGITLVGLTMLNEIIIGADRFLAFT